MKQLYTILFLVSALSLTACSATDLTENQNLPEVSNAIIGGEEVPPNHESLQHIVALYDPIGGGLCTGTLIDTNIVLTAAHCIGDVPAKMVIFFGNRVTDKTPFVRVSAAVVSPLWPSNQYHRRDTGDIALVKFEGKLPDYFKPLPILPESYLPYLRENTLVLMLGYGINNGVDKTGAGVLRMVGARILNPKFSATEIVIDQTKGKGACHGDSGGPAIIFIGSQAHVWGVTSRSYNDPDDHCAQASIYTSATAYLVWIQETIAKLKKLTPEGRNNPFGSL